MPERGQILLERVGDRAREQGISRSDARIGALLVTVAASARCLSHLGCFLKVPESVAPVLPPVFFQMLEEIDS